MTSLISKTAGYDYHLSLSRFVKELGFQMKAHAVLSVVCITSFICAVVIKTSLGKSVGSSAWLYLEPIITVVLPIAFGLSGIGLVAYLIFKKRSQTPLKDMLHIYRDIVCDGRRWAKAVPAIGIMMFGFMAFTELKPVIPDLNPYQWDMAFMKLDRWLHFGQDPWRLLQPVFGYKVPTLIINFIYNLWFFVMFGFWVGSAITAKDYGWERQFLLSFILCWMIGGVFLAVIFSSMGPAFYDVIDSANNPFAEQMLWLNAMNDSGGVYALETQNMLLESYLNPDAGGIAGISAMPSMHNAISTVFMLAAFRIHKAFGWVMAGFLTLILIGSVHLAWHYAVDSYAGILIGLICWWMAQRLTLWQDKALKLT